MKDFDGIGFNMNNHKVKTCRKSNNSFFFFSFFLLIGESNFMKKKKSIHNVYKKPKTKRYGHTGNLIILSGLVLFL